MNNSTTNNGTNILGLLGVLFVGLKLTGFISWSWWWVTIPFWGGLVLVLVFIVLGSLAVGLASVFGSKKKRSRRFA